MNIYDFDEFVLLDNKGKNTVKIQPTEISIDTFGAGSVPEIEVRGILRDDDWRPNSFHFEPARRKGRKVDYGYGKLYGYWEMPKIKDVIFNDPATIVFWADGTKTVVQCQDGDIFDPEKGLVMATTKKALGNKGNYYNELKKWLPKDKEATLEYTLNTSATSTSINDMGQSIVDAVNKMLNQLEGSK
jgi:hypothetical protein